MHDLNRFKFVETRFLALGWPTLGTVLWALGKNA